MRRSGAVLILPFVVLARPAHPQGMPQGPEFRANTYTTLGQSRPGVAADLGGFVVVWNSNTQDGSGEGIFGQRYSTSGVALGPEFRISAYTTANQFWPSTAADASGNFVVVWNSNGQDGSSSGIFGQRFAATGVPLGQEFRINTYTADSQQTPRVAVGPSGDFVVVWNSYEQDGSGFGVFGQRYDGFGAPVGGEFRINTYTPYGQFLPVAAVDPTGTFLVVWSSVEDGSDGIVGQRYAASGVPLGGEFMINTYTTGRQYHPSISASAGTFVVVWAGDSQDGSYYGIFGQRYATSGAPLGGEFRVNSTTAGSQGLPYTAADASGNFVVVWASPQDGSGFGIFGQRYASSGAALGPEFRANTYTTSQQVFHAVAADAIGNFVIGWGSSGQDGSGYGVFVQRYSPMVPVELIRFGVD